MPYEIAILILFLIASLAAIAVRKIHLPYTVALVAIGLVLGNIGLLHPPKLTQEVLFAFFLPGLVFEAAVHLDSRAMWRDIWGISALVIPGVILSTLISAWVLVYAGEISSHIPAVTWPVALLFGAAVAATDPVAVVAIFKQLGAPKRLRLLIESESLLNDGTGIVIFAIVLSFINHEVSTAGEITLEFFKVAGLGALVGLLIGLAVSWMIEDLDDAMVVISMSVIAAYGSFLVADQLRLSGVISTVATGLILQNRILSRTIYPSVRLSVEEFWEFMAFALNSLIFLLMGFAVKLSMLLDLWVLILTAYLAMLLARFLVVSTVWGSLYPSRYRFPFSWAVIMSWGGLRGALSMVLALSIPDSLPYKDVVVTMVFGVVLLSIFIQGLSIAPLATWLGVLGKKRELQAYENSRVQAMLAQSVLDEIDYLQKHHIASKETLEEVAQEYQDLKKQAEAAIQQNKPQKETLTSEEKLRVQRHLINLQKSRLLEAYQKGSISRELFEKLTAELDAKLLEIDNLES